MVRSRADFYALGDFFVFYANWFQLFSLFPKLMAESNKKVFVPHTVPIRIISGKKIY